MAENVSLAEAHALIVKWMRNPDPHSGGSYGYDLYLPPVISKHLNNPRFGELEIFMRANMPAFTSAAWELCRRGILRPGVREYGGQGTSDGYGYSITPLGERWLKESEADPFIAVEPNHLGAMLAQHRARFGDGFQERAQEAIRCYQANAHLACCAMCGAAAESILLALASEKRNGVSLVKDYSASGGRGRVQAKVFGGSPKFIQDQAGAGLSLLKYWRDDAAHGEFAGFSEAQSFTSILLLLRLAALADEHWDELTKG